MVLRKQCGSFGYEPYATTSECTQAAPLRIGWMLAWTKLANTLHAICRYGSIVTPRRSWGSYGWGVIGSNIIVVIVVVNSAGAREFVGVSPQAGASTLPKMFSAKRNTLAANAGGAIRHGDLRSALTMDAVRHIYSWE